MTPEVNIRLPMWGCDALLPGTDIRRAPVSSDDDTVVKQLAAVIAWEMHAQAGVRRPLNEMPSLIADSLLDYFEVRLKPGADIPE